MQTFTELLSMLLKYVVIFLAMVLIFKHCSISCHAQPLTNYWNHVKENRNEILLNTSLSVVSGFSQGTHETLTTHYSRFKKRFRRASDNYWNPQISWVNKYNRNIPLNSIIVIGSDAYHDTKTISRSLSFLSYIPKTRKKIETPLSYQILDAFIQFTIQSIIFQITYENFYHE